MAFGRGPKSILAHLIGDLLVVRLQGVLTAAEQHLVRSLPEEKGRDLLKQVRTQLIEAARGVLEALVEEVTGKRAKRICRKIRAGWSSAERASRIVKGLQTWLTPFLSVAELRLELAGSHRSSWN